VHYTVCCTVLMRAAAVPYSIHSIFELIIQSTVWKKTLEVKKLGRVNSNLHKFKFLIAYCSISQSATLFKVNLVLVKCLCGSILNVSFTDADYFCVAIIRLRVPSPTSIVFACHLRESISEIVMCSHFAL